jgi:hypothetical protein
MPSRDPGRSTTGQYCLRSRPWPGVLRDVSSPAREIGCDFARLSNPPPWDDEVILESFDRRERVIDFGGHLYQRSDVLNWRLEAGLRVGCGDVVEGWILASGLRRIPAEYRDFFIVQCEVIVWDPNGREFRANANLSVLRTPRRISQSTRGSRLFGPAENEQSRELHVAEEPQLRYLELVRQEKTANQRKAAVSADMGRVEKEPKRNAQKSNRK